ncbi:AAA-like domain protein [Gimesia alba]|uniref:AAA-like domain protein n=2 Tax=Gimesia alba TaxID=2527973 RepID=A0A517RHY6_9PLAN|nr:AAA-like domain protein [Gimesia alba]
MLISISVSADNKRGPQYVEQMLNTLHRERSTVSFEFGQHRDTVALYCRFPDHLQGTIEGQLRAAYPNSRLTIHEEDVLAPPRHCRTISARLWLWSDINGIKWWQRFTDNQNRILADPISGILTTLSSDLFYSHIAITTRPASVWRRAVFFFRRRFQIQRDPEFAKPSGHLFSVSIHLIVGATASRKPKRMRRKLRELIAAFGSFENPPFTRFVRTRFWPRTFILSTPELATLWHPTTATVQTDRLETQGYRRLEPPAGLATREREKGTTVLGAVDFHGRSEVFGMRLADRRRHLAIMGKTGMGKSTLIKNLIGSDIAAGHGVALIDPHGDLAEEVIAAIPSHRTNDVVYFDPSDRSYPIGLNLLDCPNLQLRHLTASAVSSVIQKVYGVDPSHTPRLLDILRNATLALLEVPGTTLLSLTRFLGNPLYRNNMVNRVQDTFVRDYWVNEFGKWPAKEQAFAVASVQNKIRPFVIDPLLRPILGQSQNRLDLRKIMDDGRILIVNLSKGRVGEDNSNLLGSLIVTRIQMDAMCRADTPEHQRRDFFAYIDEFQNFATESFATILSEARKYRLSLTLANQYLYQIEKQSPQTLAAIFGNVGSMIAFQVGARDAAVLAEEFGGDMTPADLMTLPQFTAYTRQLIDGMPSRPFSMKTLPPQQNQDQRRLPIVLRTSRHRYARSVREVEEEIERG